MFDEEKDPGNGELDKEPEGKPEGEEEDIEAVKAKLEEERRLRVKAESALQYRKEKEKEREKGDEPVTKKDLLDLEANLTRKTLRAQVESEIKRVAENEDEAKLILNHYDATLVPTGDIAKDVRRAKLLANEAKAEREQEELEKARESKENRGRSFSGGRPEFESKEPELDPETRKLVAMNKMQWDSKEKIFKNTRGVSYDPKTGRVTEPKR